MATDTAKLRVSYSFDMDSPYGILIVWNMQKRLRNNFRTLIPSIGTSSGIEIIPNLQSKSYAMSFYLTTTNGIITNVMLEEAANSYAESLSKSFDRKITCVTKECHADK